MHAHPAPQPRRAPPDGRAKVRLPRVSRFLRPLHSASLACQALCSWVLATTVVSRWLPGRWRHPLTGYLLALCIDAVAASLALLLVTLFPAFALEEVLLLAGIVLVALTCGVGPSLLATGVGIALLEVVLPASHTFRQPPADGVDLVVLLVSGIGLSLLASQSGWARRRAEALADSLKEAQAESDQERLRLRTLLDVLPAPVAMVDAQERVLEVNPALKTLWGDPGPGPREIADFELAKAWWPATGQPVAPRAWAIVRALTMGETITNEEVEIETFDGLRKIVLDSATPIRDEGGTIRGAAGVLQDITERKRLEQALRQAEREAAARASQLEAVFEAMTDAVVVFDTNSRILQRNAADRQLFVFDPEPETLDERRALIRLRDEYGQSLSADRLVTPRALQGGVMKDPAPYVLVHTTRGAETLLNVTAAPIRDLEGHIVGGVMVMRDVTERRRLEREVARRAHELEVIFESIVDGVFVYDTGGRIVRTNSAGRRLLNLDEHPEYCSLSAYERIAHYQECYEHDEHLPPERWPLSRMLRGEVLSDPHAADVSYRALDGRRVEGSISGAPLYDADGRIIGAVMVLRDLTERARLERRTHEALQALLAMAEALVQTPDDLAPPGQGSGSAASLAAHRLAELASNLLGCSGVSISALDLERGVFQPLAVLGLSPEQEHRWWAGERRSARWMDGAHGEVLARLQAGETLVLNRTDPLQCDEPNLFNAQTFFAVPMRIGERLVGLLILYPRGTPSRYTPQEIALVEATAKLGALVIERERLLREREVAQASELALRQANEQMDAFLGMASHELKTPLTTVILGLQWGQRGLQRLVREEHAASGGMTKKLEALDEQLARTSRQATRLDRLVNDLLDVSRIQADKLAFRLELADLANIICEVVQEQRQANPQRSIQLYLPASQSMPVCADAGRIEQVVTNYLTNALKYSTEDDLVEIGAAREGGALRVWVRDRGPGIPLAEQEHIWERFHRVPGVEVCSGSGVGLGLGLYISRAIIERHHGQVGVESLPGEGATFWFTLPLAFPREELAGEEHDS